MDLLRLFSYDEDANRRVFAALRSLDHPDERMVSVFAHLLQAERVWLRRIRGDDYLSLTIWPTLSWDEMESLIEENARGYRKLLAAPDNDLDRDVHYVNSKGEKFSTPVGDIIAHVILHGAYHRGQIASALRQAGHEPLNTDFIMYVRA